MNAWRGLYEKNKTLAETGSLFYPLLGAVGLHLACIRTNFIQGISYVLCVSSPIDPQTRFKSGSALSNRISSC